jgi:HPt (histidine-containing phosphotransfer) domain-containing protein
VSKPLKPAEIEGILQAISRQQIVRTFSEQVTPEESDPSLEFDIKKALRFFENDFELLEEAFGVFVETLPSYLDAIRSAIAKGDSEALRRSAHRLKGAVANFQVEELANLALTLELMGKEKRFGEAEKTFSHLEKTLSVFVDTLKELLTGEMSRAA